MKENKKELRGERGRAKEQGAQGEVIDSNTKAPSRLFKLKKARIFHPAPALQQTGDTPDQHTETLRLLYDSKAQENI